MWINLSFKEYLPAESNNYPLLGGQMLENYFNYKKHKTDFKTEVVAGTTTFLTMAYIMFLNPFILSGEFAGPEKINGFKNII